MPESAGAVGDRQQPDMGDIVEHRYRRIEQAITKTLFEIGKRQQLLAQFRPVLQLEPAHAADTVGGLGALDRAGGDRRMPAVVAVEIAQHIPDRAGRRVEDRAFDDVRHGLQPPNTRLSASKPPWNTPAPMLLTSSVSRSGAQSKSSDHSRKVWSPSVNGVRRKYAASFSSAIGDSRI